MMSLFLLPLQQSCSMPSKQLPGLDSWANYSDIQRSHPGFYSCRREYGWLSKLWSFLGPLQTRCRTILRTLKRTIILTTTHMERMDLTLDIH